MDIVEIVSKSGVGYNSRMLTRYLKFIDAFSGAKIKGSTELHHILPKSIFPQYSNLKTNAFNKAHLPSRAHYVAHSMLCKIFPTETAMWYALYCMSHQVNQDTQPSRSAIRVNSRMYETAKRVVSKLMSEKRKGTKLSTAHRALLKRIHSTDGARRANIWRQYKNGPQFEDYSRLADAVREAAASCWSIPSAISRHTGVSIDTVSSIMDVENISATVSQSIAKVFRNYGSKFVSYDQYVDSITTLHNSGASVYLIADQLDINVHGVETLLKRLGFEPIYTKRKSGVSAGTEAAAKVGMKPGTHVWITDGSVSKRHPVGADIPTGWRRGRTTRSLATIDC